MKLIPIPDFAEHPRFKWTILAFVAAAILVASLVIWQLSQTDPRKWCTIKAGMTSEHTNACMSVFMHLLDIKDHAVIGLLGILAITVVSVVVVALGVHVSGGGPGGTSIDISADKTKIETADAHVEVPTPPAKDGK